MRIQYCSDLHLEDVANNNYLVKNPLKVTGDILILAGDIVPLNDMYLKNPFFSFISENYQQIFWVPGNHEFYHKDIGRYASSFNIQLNSKISLVHNIEVEYEKTNFVFSTLWARITGGKEKPAEQAIPDFSAITKNGNRFSVADFNALHTESLEFLNTALQKKKGKTIVVSHHAPTRTRVSPKYKYSLLNEAFFSDQEKLIIGSEANFWIYGHTHFNHFPFQIGKTIILTNQLGYQQSRECSDFRADAYFII